LLSNIVLDDLDKELEQRGHTFCRYADDCNIYVRSQRAGERIMETLTTFLEKRLKLKVNREKSAVDRPWTRKFLGYSMTVNRQPKLKPAPASVKRLKDKLKETLRRGKGRSLSCVIEQLTPMLRGWANYFKLSGVKGIFQELDAWIRRRMRCLLWRQWKRPRTRAKKLMQQGLEEIRAWKSAYNGRGPWWNAGASHMNEAFPKTLFDRLGLISLYDQVQRLHRTL
jgi:RNA-directed DNA polymerase